MSRVGIGRFIPDDLTNFNTRSPRSGQASSFKQSPRLIVYLMCQDDPKKCTSRKLSRFGLATPTYSPRRIPRKAIVLNPFAAKILSPDEARGFPHGLVAVDCSWRRAGEVFSNRLPGVNRRLPTLLAGNPVNYGHRSVLSSVEALSAALCIGGQWVEAERLLSIFKWGHTFMDLNRGPLEDYGKARNIDEILQIEKEYFPPVPPV